MFFIWWAQKKWYWQRHSDFSMKAITFYRRKTFLEALQTNIIQLQALRRLLGCHKSLKESFTIITSYRQEKVWFFGSFSLSFCICGGSCKKVKFKVEKVSGKFVHICTHLVSSCLKDIKSFSFDGHWPGLQKVTRILSCCPEGGLKARLWKPKILLCEETVGIYHQFQLNKLWNCLF